MIAGHGAVTAVSCREFVIGMEGTKAQIWKMVTYAACAGIGTYMVFGLEYQPMPNGEPHALTRAQTWAAKKMDEFWMLDEEKQHLARQQANSSSRGSGSSSGSDTPN